MVFIMSAKKATSRTPSTKELKPFDGKAFAQAMADGLNRHVLKEAAKDAANAEAIAKERAARVKALHNREQVDK